MAAAKKSKIPAVKTFGLPKTKQPVKRKKSQASRATQALETLAKHLNRSRWDGKSLFMIHDIHPEVADFCFDEPGYEAQGHRAIRHMVFACLGRRMGFNLVNNSDFRIGLNALAKHWGSIIEHFDDADVALTPELLRLDRILDDYRTAQRLRLADAVSKGMIEFDDIPFLFSPGDEVVTTIHGERMGGLFENITYHQTMMGSYYLVTLKVIHNFKFGGAQNGSAQIGISEFSGLRAIQGLPLASVTPEEREVLTARGEKYREFARKASYVQYDGALTQSSYWSNKTFRASGRIMVDQPTFQKIDNDQWSQEMRASGIIDSGTHNQRVHLSDEVGEFVIADTDLWRTFPFLCGFSFSAKQWGRMSVSGMTPIQWREDAFEKLVLEDDRKELVRALVEHQGGTFEDIISGKGGGIIFLLVGPPGQGKTLTAESIAELLHRPLYSISVGELGTDPDALEIRLRQILDVAMIWNAVLLLDEADIFLEQRNSDDIVRNAMVGVFLRLLEYHQGLLFLTTNRPRDLDQAFMSRISVMLEFAEADQEKREKIWLSLLNAANLDVTLSHALSRYNLNGRQIKNVIRLSQTLAKARGNSKVSLKLIEDVMRRCQPVQRDATIGQHLSKVA